MTDIQVQELTDPGPKTLADWYDIILGLTLLYGRDAVLLLDAGYSNIRATVSYDETKARGLFTPHNVD